MDSIKMYHFSLSMNSTCYISIFRKKQQSLVKWTNNKTESGNAHKLILLKLVQVSQGIDTYTPDRPYLESAFFYEDQVDKKILDCIVT